MAVNDLDHPEVARERQDVDVTFAPLAAEKNYQTGRGNRHAAFLLVHGVLTSNPSGGAGNIHHLTAAEQAEAMKHNEHVRKSSKGRGNSKDRDHVRELAEKGKEKLFGHKEPKS